MTTRNAIGQEIDTRHALLYSEILAVLNRRADPFGNAWVEVADDEHLRIHTRYTDDGKTYQITQTVRLRWDVTELTPASRS